MPYKRILIPILVLAFFSGGCYTKTGVSNREVFQTGNLYYVVHSGDSAWILANCMVSEGMLTGMKAPVNLKPDKKLTADLYIAPANAVITSGNTVSFPIASIAKAEREKINKVRTFESLTLAVLTAIPVIFFLSLLIGGGYDM